MPCGSWRWRGDATEALVAALASRITDSIRFQEIANVCATNGADITLSQKARCYDRICALALTEPT